MEEDGAEDEEEQREEECDDVGNVAAALGHHLGAENTGTTLFEMTIIVSYLIHYTA